MVMWVMANLIVAIGFICGVRAYKRGDKHEETIYWIVTWSGILMLFIKVEGMA